MQCWMSIAVFVMMGCGDLGPGSVDPQDPQDDPTDSEDPTPPGVAAACKRVDLVFAVDDSSSMSEEKQAMRSEVFPGFAEALLDIGAGLEDYRVAVIDACPTPANFHTAGQGGSCDFSSGSPWMHSDSPQLVNEFECVADIVSDDAQCDDDLNDDEQPASAAAAALELPMIGSGPNDGFLRDDALLVVVAITDEDEQPRPSADAGEVYDRLVAIKGDVSQMVFLGIGGASACDGVYGGAKEASKLKNVAGLFEAEGHGLFWDLCEGQLEDGLTAAMNVIESACEDFCNSPDGCEDGPDPTTPPPID